MSLTNKFKAITIPSYLKKIVDKKLDIQTIFEDFKTKKVSYRVAIKDILHDNDINKLQLKQFKYIINALSKLTDAALNAGLLSLNTKSKLYDETRKLVKKDWKIHLQNVISLTNEEAIERQLKQKENVKRNNKNQTVIEDKTIETMISKLMANERKTLAQKIMLVQVSLGTRLI